jgi:electron transfer flavoprotein alpha subunit
MADVMVFLEQRNCRVSTSGSEVVTVASSIASELGGSVHVLVLGGPGTAENAAELGQFGAVRIDIAEHAELSDYNPEGYATVIRDRVNQGDYAAVMLAATTVGKDLAPRVAALLDVPLATDVTGVRVEDGRVVIERPVYAGKALVELEIKATPALMSLRPNIFPACESPESAQVHMFRPDIDPCLWPVRVLERKALANSVLDVSDASTVVSGGRGMRESSNWRLLEQLRDALGPGAALGASRAVVDAGWRPHGEQVGQTGKTIAPKLYIAVGISGAIQHLAGMRTAQTIVAINDDADAPIFDIANYGIVGNLFEVIPRLVQEIEALKEQS